MAESEDMVEHVFKERAFCWTMGAANKLKPWASGLDHLMTVYACKRVKTLILPNACLHHPSPKYQMYSNQVTSDNALCSSLAEAKDQDSQALASVVSLPVIYLSHFDALSRYSWKRWNSPVQGSAEHLCTSNVRSTTPRLQQEIERTVALTNRHCDSTGDQCYAPPSFCRYTCEIATPRV